MSGLRVLSVRQPWAAAIIHGGKTVENRTRSLGPYRGPVLIHAGLTKDDATDSAQWPMLLDLWHKRAGYPLAFGRIIGVVDLVDVHRSVLTEGGVLDASGNTCAGQVCSPWSDPDAHHLVLRNPRALDQPLAWTGGLGLRKAPQLDLIGDYLAIASEGCTCGQAGVGGPHEPACGWEPLARLEAVSRG